MGGRAVDGNAWDDILKIGAGGASFGGGLAFVRWFIMWLTGRHDQREADLRAEDGALDRKWQAYREAIEAENAKLRTEMRELEQKHAECHAKSLELERRLARLEGFASARGDLRQGDQVMISGQRVIDGGEG